ncbi:MAG: ABC transporter ATP-binding protein [Euzebyales bacterium]|nr:ABC transporter ATP-binding protein [Euzebyales bacterium]MBA3621647.1 ABC transporter ATP-binding protein [Euzebyales bacterium]
MQAATQATTDILALEQVDAGYGEMQILHDVSIRVPRGKLVTLIGPNGAGKSTVIKTMLGMLRPTRGTVTFDGADISGVPTHQIIARGMGYVPQGRIVFPDMTVMENLEMGGFTVRDQQRSARQLDYIFGLFPTLADRRKQRAGTMSGGQQQMLAIGRALMSDPNTLLLDEPSLGLSPRFVDIVFDALQRLRDDGLMTMVMVEQNATKALALADQGYVLEFGRNRFAGTGQELLGDQRVRRLYLGG